MPKVLLATAHRWLSSPRIAMSFADAGWSVEVVCPGGHAFEMMRRAVGRVYDYRFFAGPRSLRRAISAAEPDLIVPCDDLVGNQLRHLCDRESSSPRGDDVLALLTRSLGPASSYPVLESRSSVAAIAKEEGVATPETSTIRSVAGLEGWLARHGLPAVLKTDGSSGGYGVRVVTTVPEALEAFAFLSTPIGLVRAMKRTLVDQGEMFLMPAIHGTRPVVNAQSWRPGRNATCTVACWRGKVLAMVALEALQTLGQAGPSSVVRAIESPDIALAVSRMAGRLQISGLCGFDFMIEQGTGKASLIEINARATQTTHLRLGAGRDLPLALRCAVTGEDLSAPPSQFTSDTVALFPQEWQRDPNSPFLKSAHHDVPWNEPEFLRFCLREERRGIRRLLAPDGRLAKLLSKTTSSHDVSEAELKRIGH